MFEYKSKLHPYHGETRPEDVFEIDAALLAEAGWELVTVVPVLGKMDLVSFWKRSQDEVVPALGRAIVKANDILDAAIQKDGGRGELLDAAVEAAAVLDDAIMGRPASSPVEVSDLQSRLPAIGMDDRSELLDDVPETSAEADLKESFEAIRDEMAEKLGRPLTQEELEECSRKARGG